MYSKCFYAKGFPPIEATGSCAWMFLPTCNSSENKTNAYNGLYRLSSMFQKQIEEKEELIGHIVDNSTASRRFQKMGVH